MILCVTPNVALDRTLFVPTLQPGHITRATKTMLAAGGKGLNVARAIGVLGGQAMCAGLLGGYTGQQVAELAEQEGLQSAWTYMEAETRTCIIAIADQGQDATVLNEPGPTIPQTAWERLQADVVRQAASAAVVCLCGSLPLGALPDAPVGLIRAVRQADKPIWVDTGQTTLPTALRGKPTGVKVNVEEAGLTLHRAIETEEDAFSAAEQIHHMGIEFVILTKGADGAVLVTAEGRWHVKPPAVSVVSTVGSGDAFLAGLLVALERGQTLAEALQYGSAAGTANTLRPGGANFSLTDFERILAKTTVTALG